MMLRNVSAALVIGCVALGEAGTALAAMPHERAAAGPQQVVAQKRVPQSRLVKPKALQPRAASSAARPPVVDRTQTVAQTMARHQAESRLIRNAPAPSRYEPQFNNPAATPPPEKLPADELPSDVLPKSELPTKTLPSELVPSDELPADGLPTDDLPLNRPPSDTAPLDLELDDEPADRPEINPLEEPLPKETGPLDLDRPTPSQPEAPAEVPADQAPDDQVSEELPRPEGIVYRLEPPGKLIPVKAEELKPGVIYLHDDAGQGRQVWSFVQANGKFWHAFGPGTTQALVHFDLRMTDEQALEELRKIDPKLAFNVTNQGARVFMRLQPDNTWKLVRTNSVPSIFDAETNRRWEMQWGRYLPVTHNHGDTWTYEDGQYWAPHWHTSMRPH